MQLWKLHIKAHTHHIWLTTLNRVNGTTLSHMWKFFILLIARSTWIRWEAICCVCTTSSGVIWPLLPGKGGMLRETPRGRRSCTVNPLPAITESPLAKDKFRNPERITISLSEIWGVYSWLMTPRWDANQTLQSSVIFVWAKKLTVKTKTLVHLAADFGTVNYDPGRRVFLLKSAGMCSSRKSEVDLSFIHDFWGVSITSFWLGQINFVYKGLQHVLATESCVLDSVSVLLWNGLNHTVFQTKDGLD